MKRFLLWVFGLLLAVSAILGTLYYFGLWSPNSWVARAYPIRGIDVSNHQGSIDWDKVAASGVSFAYIKATEGADFRDRSFAENWRESARHGVPRGAYHFFTMKSSGLEQARNMIATVPVDPRALPPAVDLEFFGNSKDRRSPADFRRELDVFLDLLRRTYGKEPMVYTDRYFSDAFLKGASFRRLWTPSYFTAPSWPDTGWLIWQYSQRGRVPGVGTYVDLNVFNGDSEMLRGLAQGGKRSDHKD